MAKLNFHKLAFNMALAHQGAYALNNGLGATPQMGYNSWYDLFMSPTEAAVLESASSLKAFGFQALGYTYVNLDDGMVSGRYPNGSLIPDTTGFPNGMRSLSDALHSSGFKFGVYTDRGPTTCGGRPAAQGHEAIDANTYANEWGVDYVKEDSCNAPTDHETAMSEYGLMRDSLNATGRSIFFSLCGWENWYASVGAALGNSARIGPDDSNWQGILTDIDDMAPLWPFSGPGYMNDPCLLLGADSSGKDAVTELQSRAQFSMWAVLRAPLLLSQTVRNMTSSRLATYTNAEVIGVSQDAMGRQGIRLKGGPVSFARRGLRTHRKAGSSPAAKRRVPGTVPDIDVAVTMQPCTGSAAQVWQWNVSAPGFLSNPASASCLDVNDCGTQLIAYPCVTSGGTCAGPNSYANEEFSLSASDGTLRSALAPSQCVTGGGEGSDLELETCTGLPAQKFAYDAPTSTVRSSDGALCMTVGDNADGTNVWGRPLSGGAWALTYINTGMDAADASCDFNGCLSGTGWEADQLVSVRDLWAQADVGNFTAGAGFNVSALPAQGGVAMFRMAPIW